MNEQDSGGAPVGLHLREVTKRFTRGGAAAVDGVSLDVLPGQFIAVMGRSGSGKSTLLRAAAGLEQVSAGSVTWRGVAVNRLPARARARLRRTDFAFVHQDYNLLPALTAAENVELPARLGGRRLGREEVMAALAAMDVHDKADRRPAHLSGGEQQRVALARALAVRAHVVFADEPTGALDSANRDRVLDHLEAFVADGQRSVVMVTHDPWVAARAHRVVFMQDGFLRSSVERPDVAAVLDVVGQLDAATSTPTTLSDALAPATAAPGPRRGQSSRVR